MSFFSKLKSSLSKTSSSISESVKSVFTSGKLDADTLEELEDALIQADMGIETAMELVNSIRKQKFPEDVSDLEVRTFLADKIADKLITSEQELDLPKNNPTVVMMIGVNGSGKTTSIGKLSARFQKEGKSVMVAAGDTFRAGAVNQLKVWAERANVPIVTPEKEGADPASVIFKAYDEAKENNIDVLICDTAGRLQNRQDLMDELAKIFRVLKKQDESAPHASLLVLDGTVGQNAHNQVEAFKDTAEVTGLIVNKLDSSAKGGVIVALADKFKLPIHFIGIGEAIEDLRPFEAKAFASALMDLEQIN